MKYFFRALVLGHFNITESLEFGIYSSSGADSRGQINSPPTMGCIYYTLMHMGIACRLRDAGGKASF